MSLFCLGLQAERGIMYEGDEVHLGPARAVLNGDQRQFAYRLTQLPGGRMRRGQRRLDGHRHRLASSV